MLLSLTKIAGAVALAAGMAVAGVGALAQALPATAEQSTVQVEAEARGGRGFCGEAGQAAVAEALDLTVEELKAQLWAGESLADLAEAAGVELTDLQATVQEACQAAAQEKIEQAVTDGDLTREKADWLLEGLEKGYWGPGAEGGFGFGGRGGPGGRGRHGGPGGPGFFNHPEIPATPPDNGGA